MHESILLTIRQMIGPSASYEVFDPELIMNINAALTRLCELGVGPATPFRIEDEYATWDDLVESAAGLERHTEAMLHDIQQYLYLKVKMIFDPPANGSVMNVWQAQIDLLEWTMKEVAQFGY